MSTAAVPAVAPAKKGKKKSSLKSGSKSGGSVNNNNNNTSKKKPELIDGVKLAITLDGMREMMMETIANGGDNTGAAATGEEEERSKGKTKSASLSTCLYFVVLCLLCGKKAFETQLWGKKDAF